MYDIFIEREKLQLFEYRNVTSFEQKYLKIVNIRKMDDTYLRFSDKR